MPNSRERCSHVRHALTLLLLAAACGDANSTDDGSVNRAGAPASAGTSATAGTSPSQISAGSLSSAAGTTAAPPSSGRGGTAAPSGTAGLGASGSLAATAGASASAGAGAGASGSGGSTATGGAGSAAGSGAAGRGGAAGTCAAGSAGRASAAGSGGGSAAQTATFTQVYALFRTNCSGSSCHVGATRPGDGLSMSDQATAYTNLVNANAASCQGAKRVVPSDPNTSELVHALSHTMLPGCARTPMMPAGRSKLAQRDIDLVVSWVRAGAKND